MEFRVAVAGPLVTLADRAVCFGLGAAHLRAPDGVLESAAASRRRRRGDAAVLGYLTSINLIVLVFNLIPGFPLDGGRIARAIAWRITGDRNRPRASRHARAASSAGCWSASGAFM